MESVADLRSPEYDGIVLVCNTVDILKDELTVLQEPIVQAQRVGLYLELQ